MKIIMTSALVCVPSKSNDLIVPSIKISKPMAIDMDYWPWQQAPKHSECIRTNKVSGFKTSKSQKENKSYREQTIPAIEPKNRSTDYQMVKMD
jgi:hypothetical protein